MQYFISDPISGKMKEVKLHRVSRDGYPLSIEIDYCNNGGKKTITIDKIEHGPQFKLNNDMAYVDRNFVHLIQKYNIAKPTGDIGFVGFQTYPCYKFDLSKLD